MERAYGLEIPTTLEEVCDPRRLALVVYDMQVGILHQIAQSKQLIARVSQVLNAAREAGVRGACAKQDIGAVVEAVDLLLHDRTYFPLTPSGL